MCNYRIKNRDERRNTQEFLYWFTHQELRPVHLTPRCNPLKTDTINYKHTEVLEPFKNLNNQSWKTLFQHTLHSKKPYLEWLTFKTNTRKNKEKITPETMLQEHKPVVLFAPRQYQHLHPVKGSSRTSSHVFSFWKMIRSVIGSRWRQQTITTCTTRRVTRGSGGREIREEITRYGDWWSVTEWTPTDQFQDKHPEGEREKQ